MARRRQRHLRHARQMRQDSTWGEIRLWQELRRSQLGVRFRRQEPIGPYIVDLVCLPSRLVVEIDGSSHDYEDSDYAMRRDRWFHKRGWTMLHFTERYVLEDLDGTLDLIRSVLDDPATAADYDD